MRRLYALLLMTMLCGVMFAQQRNISGVVLDGELKGETLIGATVAYKGASGTKGTITDQD